MMLEGVNFIRVGLGMSKKDCMHLQSAKNIELYSIITGEMRDNCLITFLIIYLSLLANVHIKGQTTQALPVGGDGMVYKATIVRPADKAASIGIRKFLEPGYDTLFFRYYACYKPGASMG